MGKADKRKADSENAMIETADTVRAIQNKVAAIDSGLSAEQDERKRADEENRKYTEKWNRVSLGVAIAGVVLALAAFVVALIK